MTKLASVAHTATEGQTLFAIPFSYIDQSDITVYLDGVLTTAYTFSTASTIKLNSGVTSGTIVRIKRKTSRTARKVDYSNGAVLTEPNLDKDSLASFYTGQEIDDAIAQTITFPDTDATGVTLPDADTRKGKILGFSAIDGSVELQTPDGKTLIIGTVDPTTEGGDGDGYINKTTLTFFGPKASGAWPAGQTLQGASGTNGNTILNGTGAPTGGVGVDGDFYIDNVTAYFYGPKAGGVWPSPLVIETGGSPRSVLNGTVAPTTEGVDGDFYINTTTWDIYGPKAAGAWGSPTSLVGPAAGASGLSIVTDTNSGGGVDDELLGPFKALGDNATPAEKEFVRVAPYITKAAAGAEYGRLLIQAMNNGTLSEFLRIGALTSSDVAKLGIGLSADSKIYRDFSGTWRAALQRYEISSYTFNNDVSYTLTGIPSGAFEAIYEFEDIRVSTDDVELHIQVTNSGVEDTAANYDWANGTANTNHDINSYGVSASNKFFIGQKAAAYSPGADTGERLWGDFTIRRPSGTSAIKGAMFNGAFHSSAGAATQEMSACFGRGFYASTSAVDGIKIFPQSGTIVSGTVRLWAVI